MPYLAYSKTLFISGKLNRNVVCLSSLTGASNPRNDGSSVFSVAVGYSLGMVEIEGSDIRNFIYQTDRVGQTDDAHSITSCIASSYDFFKFFNLNCTPTVGYSLGMVEIEGSDNRNFIHQTLRSYHYY